MKPNCNICNIPMDFKEKVETKKPYRIRRFICPVCGNITTIFADGERDMVSEPKKALKSVEDLFKEQRDLNENI